MNGPEHYREAETCVRQGCASDEQGQLADAHIWLQLAQVHATLACAAAFVDGPAVMRPEDRDEWDRATGRSGVTR